MTSSARSLMAVVYSVAGGRLWSSRGTYGLQRGGAAGVPRPVGGSAGGLVLDIGMPFAGPATGRVPSGAGLSRPIGAPVAGAAAPGSGPMSLALALELVPAAHVRAESTITWTRSARCAPSPTRRAACWRATTSCRSARSWRRRTRRRTGSCLPGIQSSEKRAAPIRARPASRLAYFRWSCGTKTVVEARDETLPEPSVHETPIV